jgi:hypothetical protein
LSDYQSYWYHNGFLEGNEGITIVDVYNIEEAPRRWRVSSKTL